MKPNARSYSAWIERVVELLPKNVHFEDVSPRFWRMHFGWGESPRDAVAAALEDSESNRAEGATRSYRATFGGRKIGAIGKFYRIATTVEAPSAEEARRRLYNHYEHIAQLQLTPKSSRGHNRCGCDANHAKGRVQLRRGAWAHIPDTIRADFRGSETPTRSEAPPKSFQSPKGRIFTLGPREKRGSGHEAAGFNGYAYPIFFEGKRAGKIWWTPVYGLSKTGRPQWSASTREIVWSGDLPPTGIGFDVGPEPAAKATLARWARNVDDVLDWREGKPVRSIYAGGRVHMESGQPVGIFQRSR